MLVSEIRTLEQLRQLEPGSFYVSVDGRIVDWETLVDGVAFDVHIRLRGGKGGFGSLLRSFRIHRSTNQLMCRDLTGRRLADVKEEEKLRKWIENAGNREEEKRRLRQEKYEKLKSGPPKHNFEDPDYIRTREKLLDEADDAFDAGMASLLSGKKNKEEPITADEDAPGPSGIAVKRKAVETEKRLKKPKLEDTGQGEVKPPEIVRPEAETSVAASTASDTGTTQAKETTDAKAADDVKQPPKKLADIVLDDYESAASLEALGLEQLKYALEVRGLKCGGTLSERAVRLFSVRGLQASEYPKAIKAAPPKKRNK